MTSLRAECSCGQLSLEASAPPLRVSMCHCLACQRRTGSTYGAQARFDPATVTVSGAATTWVRVGDEGSRARFHFCATCGATVWYTNDDAAEPFVAVPVGAFADPAFPPPQVSVYEERRHPWVSTPPDAEHLF